jgi:dienelactone hydrolase
LNQMQAVGDSAGQHRFRTSGLSSLITTIALEDTAGRTLDSLVVERFFVGPGVKVAPVSVNGLRGRLFIPARQSAPGIIVLGGSDGGFPDDEAALLATNGYFALSLAYFGVDSLPSELAKIPLDYVAQAIEWLRVQPGVWSERVALFGTSKGAEAALLIASHVPEVRAVVAYAPSSVAWSCICAEAALPSWTFRGDSVASVPPGADPSYVRADGEPLRPTVNYLYRLRQAPTSAVIPVESITGLLLLVAGGDDQLWPSLPMARAIMERRASLRGHPDDELLSYPDAGHLIGKAFVPAGSTRVAGGRLETGGTPADNARAQADAWPRVLAFLGKALAR